MAILPTTMLVITFILLAFSSDSATIITQFQSLPYGTTLVSEDGTFELGFFDPGSSSNRYLGIWFKKIPQKTFVWVANRDNPIKDNNSTKLTLTKQGNLVLLNQNNTVIWSTNTTTKAINVVAHLLDSGNLVLRDEKDNNSENYLWQSFDYPSDTILPGMKLGWDLTNGLNLNKYLTAWNNWEDPSSGHFTYSVTRSNVPELHLLNGSSLFYRSGPWNGIRFSGTPSLKRRPLFTYNFVYEKNQYYFQFYPRNSSLISRIVLNQTLYTLQRFIWVEGSNKWELNLEVPRDICDGYDYCGSFAYCVSATTSPMCVCLSGFEPKSPQNWDANKWSEGCMRSSKSWKCKDKNRDGFVVFKNMKLPDTEISWINRSTGLEECKEICRENCSCTAYGNSDITGTGTGCILWYGELLDLRQLPDAGQDLYVRLDITEMGDQNAKGDSRKVAVVVPGIVSSIVAMVVIFLFIYWITKTKFRAKGIMKPTVKINESKEDLELPSFDFDTIACATNDFSSDNKLSQGGFGPVYKAWRLWKECMPMEFIDTCLKDSYIFSEALRCIHIGLSCVQHHPYDRPDMKSVVAMLTSESVLPQPEEPVFLTENSVLVVEDLGQVMHYSTSELTISRMEPR
ncbi:unnamed protein product [Sphenostylis stenocarpa]|uniref:Uncharacterized protein n=1 Tax=Sphenostylis stenocarpa TaxID=92480 RepID=A0AA86W655_9FABA|nr:unnamed protein product [Sphenostylis stenocarpa]